MEQATKKLAVKQLFIQLEVLKRRISHPRMTVNKTLGKSKRRIKTYLYQIEMTQ